MRRSAVLILLILMACQSVLGMSFEDLANSYDYDTISTIGKVTGISHNISDDKVSIDISFFEKNADFDYVVILNDQARSYSHHCFKECEIGVSFNFSLNALKDMNNVSVKIFNNGYLERDYINYYDFDINSSKRTGFAVKSMNITEDYERNGLLWLNLTTKNFEDGVHEFRFYISSSDGNYYFVKNLEVLNNETTASFELGYDSNYTVLKIVSEDAVFDVDYVTKKYDFSKIRSITESIDDESLIINILLDDKYFFNYYTYDCYNKSIPGVMDGYANSNGVSLAINAYNPDNSTVCFPLNIIVVIGGFAYHHSTGEYGFSDFEKLKNAEDNIITSFFSKTAKKVSTSFSSIANSTFAFFSNSTDDDGQEDIRIGSEIQPSKKEVIQQINVSENASAADSGIDGVTGFLTDERVSYINFHSKIFYLSLTLGLVLVIVVLVGFGLSKKLPEGINKY